MEMSYASALEEEDKMADLPSKSICKYPSAA